MRRTITLSLLILVPLLCMAQYQADYEYDNAGNRIGHVIVIEELRSQPGASEENRQYSTVYSDMIDGHRINIGMAATGQLRIEILGLSDTDICRISIYDIQGKQIISQQVKQEQTILDLGNLTKGIYILKLDINNNPISKKIIKR